MDFDFAAFYKRLESEVRTSTDFGTSISSMMDWSARRKPHLDWKQLTAFDPAKEIESARRWLPRVLKRSPSPFPVRGTYFGLGEFQDRHGVEYAELYFGLMAEYDAQDPESKWLCSELRHYPDNAYLKSKALKQGGLVCNKESSAPSLGTEGHICFSVSFAALLLRHLLDADAFQKFGGTIPIGVVTGFDSGDLLRLGEITANGFVPNASPML